MFDVGAFKKHVRLVWLLGDLFASFVTLGLKAFGENIFVRHENNQ